MVCLKCDSIQLGATEDLFYLEIGIVRLVDLTIIILAWPRGRAVYFRLM